MLEIFRLNSNTIHNHIVLYVHEISKNSIDYISPVKAILVTS